MSDQTTSETPSETVPDEENAPVEETVTAAPVDVDESTDESADDITDAVGGDDSSSEGGDGRQ